MHRSSYEFAFFAIIIVGAGTALLMWQHMTHTAFLTNLISGGLNPSVPNNQGPSTTGLAANVQLATDTPIVAPSTATGVWTPTGPDTNLTLLAYNPKQPMQ